MIKSLLLFFILAGCLTTVLSQKKKAINLEGKWEVIDSSLQKTGSIFEFVDSANSIMHVPGKFAYPALYSIKNASSIITITFSGEKDGRINSLFMLLKRIDDFKFKMQWLGHNPASFSWDENENRSNTFILEKISGVVKPPK